MLNSDQPEGHQTEQQCGGRNDIMGLIFVLNMCFTYFHYIKSFSLDWDDLFYATACKVFHSGAINNVFSVAKTKALKKSVTVIYF